MEKSTFIVPAFHGRVWPFFAAAMFVLALVTFVPAVSLAVPAWLGVR